ncbi:MAG TPA: polysaccharide deacetylase family protein, partial [Polyangiaceae bacterium]|nr:polysaccharide deacetylase family protein [Polyangiaceae bacterium]
MTTEAGASPRLCAVSVDLDEIPFYRQIHGLSSGERAGDHAVFDVALLRLEDFARALGIPLTFFVIGATLERPDNARKLAELASRGHELGNHTYGHKYELTRLDAAVMSDEVVQGELAIERATGQKPVGFRAPGYTVTDELLGLLEHRGYLYDSSVFPCPLYWAAKKTAISLIRLRGRKSHSVADTANVLRAPARPYRIGHPYWERGGGLLELPVQVTRGLRAPFIGTSLTVAGPLIAK